MSVPAWVIQNFEQIKRIARRHDMHCRLRVAIMNGDESLVCTCEGKLNAFGRPKTTPRERTLADVRAQIYGKEDANG